ncbi:hypothetical protein N7449_008084 [Penicillium cf. viridicatum]|uniref:Uncharacterized protein n=1 Tax=Penicillium cf. viridicatum TaxID=2972119 RepID=A0A9W9MCP1_9EURO|nr:hypothetical protein N7449_008084 [Penicillium cf. viridicatum]
MTRLMSMRQQKTQGEKATGPSIIHTHEERPLADGHGIIEWKHVTSKDKLIQHGLDFTTVVSHSPAFGLEGYGEYGRGMDMGMYE